MKCKQTALFFLFSLITIFFSTGYREVSDDLYPTYTIQEGDFLSIVAARFGTTVNDIIAINDIANADTISVGDTIKIPSLKGLSGNLSTTNVNLGDTINSLSIQTGMNERDILRINNIASLSELYVGSTLIVIQNDSQTRLSAIDTFDTGSTYLEKSVKSGTNSAESVMRNQNAGAWDISQKQLFFAAVSGNDDAPIHSISPLLDKIELKPMPIMQGEAQEIHIITPHALTLTGNILGQNLTFHQDETAPDNWYAFFAVDAEQNTGLTDLTLTGATEDGNGFDINQKVVVEPGIFTYEIVSGVDASTLEDHSNAVESDTLAMITQSSPTRSWGDAMSYPVDQPCLVSRFGNRRTYNGGSYTNFHSGVDFGVCSANNINIYAAADGTVLFASELPIHGNHTIIDHGWGVYSTYSHQSQIMVTPGQQVKRGDLIGLIGSTGRSVGPHLHWEIKVNGIYVNPLTWLTQTYP